MKLWLTALAVVVAAPISVAATSFVPQGQGSSQPPLATSSYEHVVYSSSAIEAKGASSGASYGRVEIVGATGSPEALSNDAAVYFALAGWALSPMPGSFELFALAPNAGFAFSDVTIPKSQGMTGNINVRFDGMLAPTQASANPDLIKVTAPTHNPGPVDVTVESDSVSVTYESGFAYIPALDAPAQVTPGQKVQIRACGNPGSSFLVLYSDALGAPASFPGVEGVLELDLTSLLALGEISVPATLPGGATTREGFLEFNMPENASLVGKTYFTQAIHLDPNSVTPISFTNHAVVTVKN